MAEPFASGDVLILHEGEVVEIFHRMYEKSFRLPVAWLGVNIEAKRHDQVQVLFGLADPPDQVIYGEDVHVGNYQLVFEIPQSDEPALRSFFASVAAAGGRLA